MTDALLGDLRAFAPASRAVGVAVLAVAMAAIVGLQRLQLALERSEAAIWWASNGRDLLNAASLGLLGLAVWLLGFPGPMALLLAASVLLLLLLVEGLLVRWWRLPHPTLLAVGVALALVAPLLAVPDRVHQLVSRVAAELFA